MAREEAERKAKEKAEREAWYSKSAETAPVQESDSDSHEAQESECAQEQSLARDKQTQTKPKSLSTSCKPMRHVVASPAQRRAVAKEVFDIWQKANLPLPQEGFERFWEKDFKLATAKLVPQQLTTRTIVETCKNYVQVLSMGTQSWYTIRHSFDSFATEKTIRRFMPGYFDKRSFIRYGYKTSAVGALEETLEDKLSNPNNPFGDGSCFLMMRRNG